MPFGALSDGSAVTALRIENGSAAVTLIDYGAAIQSLRVPGREGMVETVLGFDDAAAYEAGRGHLGATIGRVGNRVGGAAFSLNGRVYRLAKNNGENHFHGGLRGFDRYVWDIASAEGDSVTFRRLSPDGEEGYPGSLEMRVTYTLRADNALVIAYDAQADADTLVNPTNHAYFNLNGGGSALGHRVQIFADRFCENDANGLPTGRLLEVEGTAFDFRAPKPLGADIDAGEEQLLRCGGYDHNYCLGGSKRAAIVVGEHSGVVMTVETDMPGVQLYSANGLREQRGRGGAMMGPRQALCLETQLYPNGMQCYGFPSPVLRAGRPMHSQTTYAFSVE